MNNIRYADDTIVLADSAERLQTIVNRIRTVSSIYDLDINSKKTKCMVVSRNNIQYLSLDSDNRKSTPYVVFGNKNNRKLGHDTRSNERNSKNHSSIQQMGHVFYSHDITIPTKLVHILHLIVQSRDMDVE